jgi:hypothetical protein
MGSLCTDPHRELNYLRIPIDPPYSKPPETPLNDFGLSKREYYTTADLCKIIGIKPDTFRYRIKKEYYHEPMKFGKKRRFTEKDIWEILITTRILIRKGIFGRGKLMEDSLRLPIET